MNLGQVYTAITVSNILICSALFIIFPDLKSIFIHEDNFVENLSAILFFLSFFAGLIALIGFKKPHHHPGYIAIPILGLIGFLDEISFGERLFRLEVPEVYGAKVASFHDAIDSIDHVLYRSVKYGDYWLLFLMLAILTAALFVVVKLLRRYKRYLRFDKILDLSKRHPPFRFLLISLGFILIAMMIDFDIIGDHKAEPLMFVEEMFEMNAALTFLFGSLAMGSRQPSPVIQKQLLKSLR